MASIQKSSEKGYRIYWRLHFTDGTFREKYKTSRSKRILQEILPDIVKIETLSKRHEMGRQDLSRALSLGIVTAADVKRFGVVSGIDSRRLTDFRTDFEMRSKTESGSDHSHTANLSRAKIIEDFFKDISVGAITSEDIERFRAKRKQTVTNTTVNHDLKILRKYLDIALGPDNNPARKIKLLPEPKNRIPRCLYPHELKLIFDNLQKFDHLLRGEFGFIVRALIHTGLRRDELCRLGPENVKIHLRQIHISGKGQKSRIIGIHRSLIDELKERAKKGRIIHESIHPSSISHAFKKMLRELKLPENLSLHSLRHTYISYLLEKGISPKRVKEHAGHFSLTTTDHYTHALPSDVVDEDVLEFGK